MQLNSLDDWMGFSIENKKDIKIIFLFLFLSCIFFWKVVVYPNKMIFDGYFSDVIDFHSSLQYLISKTWTDHRELPLWNPNLFMGPPFVGEAESSLFYPLNLLYLVFPSDLVFGYMFLLDVFLIGVFSYFFMRITGADRFGSFITGIIFIKPLIKNIV